MHDFLIAVAFIAIVVTPAILASRSHRKEEKA
jgi:hypothetical protein